MDGKSTATPEGEKENSKASGGLIISLIVIIIIASLAWVYFKKSNLAMYSGGSNQPAASQPFVSQNAVQPGDLSGNQVGAISEKEIKIFNLTAVSYKFSLAEIKVKKGDRVRINLTVANGLHDWVIDEFKAGTKQITQGQSDSVEFTADRVGTFEYYCGVGNHRQMGLVGKLIVAE